jgi:SAM-dependent methyltransferase
VDDQSTLVERLGAMETAWRARPLVRRLYHDWYDLVISRLSHVPGLTIELGSGISRFKESYPGTVTTDVEPTPWTDRVADAHELPFDDGVAANLVLIDVFHHLARPSDFLAEATRVVARGGRVVILDPYCSPVSYAVYRHFHHERTDLSGPAFDDDPAAAASPLASNQARTTLIFFRHRDQYARRWPSLPLVEARRLAMLAYPLSGSFTRPQLVPARTYRPLRLVERALSPLAPLLAFRCLVVLERR